MKNIYQHLSLQEDSDEVIHDEKYNRKEDCIDINDNLYKTSEIKTNECVTNFNTTDIQQSNDNNI